MSIDILKLAAQRQEPSGPLAQQVIAALRTVHDPEIPLNIFDLGLIYRLEVDEATGKVELDMTLTSPACPVAQTFPCTVECAVKSVPGIRDVKVNLVWDPPWDRTRMSEAARLQLGLV